MKKFVGSFISSHRNLIVVVAIVLGVAASVVIGWQVGATGSASDNSKLSSSESDTNARDLPPAVDPVKPGDSTASTEAGTQDQVHGVYRGVSTAVRFDISPPLSELVSSGKGFPAKEERERDEFEDRPTGLEGPFGPQDIDQVVQSTFGDVPNVMPTPSVSFNSTIGCGGCAPPDPNGDVGPNHYVAMGNLQFQVFNKTGTSLLGPSNTNTLWSGFGGHCQTDNSGDPVVLYDQLDDRWILTQFTASTAPFFNCVAISTTPDPTGTYFRYAFQTPTATGGNFPDYPKYGMWSDALYISTREFLGGSGGAFQGVGAYAINRAQLVAGNPAAQVISFLAAPGGTAYNVGDGLLPSDLDGPTLPPAGSPNYFVGSMDDGGPYGAPQDALNIWKFHADFAVPANSTFTLTNTLPIAAIDTIPAFCSGRLCIPQPGTANLIDHLGYRQRPLHRLAYRNFGDHEAMVTNQSVEASATMSGIRWYELRVSATVPSIFQQGTYAPGTTDGIHRWMGSIAMDRLGDMALGYSASDGTVTFPSVRYTGRLAADALGTMPQGEAATIAGTGSQTTANRWGDYTSMNVDPTNDCTFWYVNEYVPTTGGNWQMRIGAFKFPTCNAATPTATATTTATATNTPTPTHTATSTATATPTVTPLPPGACSEKFDLVTAPALPTGWSSTATGSEVAWVTSATTPDTAPNDAFAPDPATVGNTELFSPLLAVPAGGGSVSFRNNYNTESTFDGMVLEISINGGAYADIVAAGGAFATGGYNGTISTAFMSPIAGRMAWTGNSGGYITTTVNLPAAANGQTIQLKWRMASDNSVAATGVRIDTITGLPCACPLGWLASTVYPVPILDEPLTSVGGNIYSFGGVSNGAIVATSNKFDGTTWTPIAPLPAALEFPSAVTDGTDIYIMGGALTGTGTPQTTNYRYNVATNTYTTLAPFTTGTWNHAAVYLNGNIYKFAGTGPATASTNVLEIYNVAGNTWTTGAVYPLSISFVGAWTQGGFIYAAGGIESVGSLASLKTYRYDPMANTWDDAAIADLPATRWGAASAFLNGGGVLAGGYVSGSVTANISNTAVSWNSATNTWSSLPNMLGERARMNGAVLRGNFYVVGGRSIASSGFVGTNDNQEFTCVIGISGTVTYGNAAVPPKYISNVTVTGAGSPTVMTTTAAPGGTAGQYTLTGFGAGSYTVSLSKTTGQNSITSNDAARIAQHVAGTLPLTTNNQKVTADVSGNGVVQSFDAALIANYVVSAPPFGTTGTWRFFLPPGPTFPVGASPTSRTYASVTGSLTGEDYIGLLIGDVTGNWVPSSARAADSRQEAAAVGRKGGGPERDIEVRLPDVVRPEGKEIVVPVSVQGIANKDVISYEFNLRYDPSVIQPVGDVADVAGTASRGLSVVTNASEPGLLRVVVYGPTPIDENGVLLNLRFTAVGSVGTVSPLTWERISFNEGLQMTATNGELRIEN